MSATVATPPKLANLFPTCPACGSDRVQFHPDGEGRCDSCGWRLRIDRHGEVRDAVPWQTAGRRPKRRGAR